MTENKEPLEICIDDLGFLEESLESRAIVMSKILKELGLKFKRYYSSTSHRSFKRVKKPAVAPPDMTIAFLVECSKDYLEFAKYRYEERMLIIQRFSRALGDTSDLCN